MIPNDLISFPENTSSPSIITREHIAVTTPSQSITTIEDMSTTMSPESVPTIEQSSEKAHQKRVIIPIVLVLVGVALVSAVAAVAIVKACDSHRLVLFYHIQQSSTMMVLDYIPHQCLMLT